MSDATATHEATVIRFGVLSTANIVRKLLPAFEACKAPFTGASGASLSLEVAAVASRDLQKGEVFAAEFGVPKTFGSYNDLLECPDIDAVYIPVPNALHMEWVVRAIQAGKHVLVEKPITLTVEEAMEIEKALEGSPIKVVVMEAFMAVHQQQLQQVVDVILRGTIGDIQHFNGTFSYPNQRISGRDASAVEGGGSLWDVGCYPIAVTRCILSAVKRAQTKSNSDGEGADQDFTCVAKKAMGVVTQLGKLDRKSGLIEEAAVPTLLPGEAVDWAVFHDRSFAGTIQFDAGAGQVQAPSPVNTTLAPVLHFTSAFNAALRRQLIIHGSKGRITIDNAFHAARQDSFIVECCPNAPQDWTVETTTVLPSPDCPASQYTSELQNFADRIARLRNVSTSAPVGGNLIVSDLLTLPFSRKNVEVIQALYRSAGAGGAPMEL